MTSKETQKQLITLGFEMIDYGYYGIYRHEYFENSDLKLVVCMDKCYFESYVYGKLPEKRGGSILDVVRQALNDESYLSEELEGVKNHAIFEPNRCARVLIENYDKINKYLNC